MLPLSTKQRYATRIVVYLAVRSEGGPVRKADISGAEEIPPDYVEQLCIKLKAAGLIRSHRGQHGGFSLARPAAEMSVADVLRALDGSVPMTACLDGFCARAGTCVTRGVWDRADRALRSVFEGVSIGELAREARSRSGSASTFDI